MRRRMKQAATMGPECSHGKWACLIGTSSAKLVIFCGYVNFPEGIHNPQIMVVKLWLALSPHILSPSSNDYQEWGIFAWENVFFDVFCWDERNHLNDSFAEWFHKSTFTSHIYFMYNICLSVYLLIYLSIDWSMYACILCLHPLPASSACIPCLLPPPIHPSIHPSHRYIEAIQCTQTQRVKTLQIPQLHNFLPRIPEVYSPGNPPGVHHLWLLHRSNTDPAASDAPSLAWTPGDLVLGVFLDGENQVIDGKTWKWINTY